MTQHQLHQTYKIIEQKESSTIVEHVVNKTKHRCSLLPIALEKEIILFHKGVRWNGELNLELSVLNYYQANRKEIFRVVEEKEKVLIITSNGLLNLAAPLRFKEHIMGNDLELMIDGLDLELNRLIFKSFVDEVPDYSIFEQGKVYDLPVTAVALFPNGKKYVSVSYLNQSFKMICPHAITTIKEGEIIPCQITYKPQSDKSHLNIQKQFLVKKYYQKNQCYSFLLKQKRYDGTTGLTRWIMQDDLGFLNHYDAYCDMNYPAHFDQVEEGDKVDLYVTDVSAAGYLNLAAALIDWTNKNYDVQTVFQQINLGGKEEDFFFNLADQFKVLQAKDAFLIDYLEQYEGNNNLWVFSYLSFLDQYIFILLAEQAYEQAQQLIQVYLNFEFWILNTSDYLTIFSKQKRENLIIKAENKLEQLTALQQVLQWYRNGEIEEKINLFHEQLLRNGYLNKEKAAQVVAIFMSIEYFRDEVFTESSTALIELGLKKNIFSENDYWMIHLRLKKEIKKLKKRFLDTLMGEDSIEPSQLKQLISFNLMVLKLGNRFADRDKRIAVSVNLLRFLSYYKSEVNYLDLAQDLILSQQYIQPQLSDDVFKLTVDDLKRRCSNLAVEATEFKDAGKIAYQDNQFIFTPKNLLKMNGSQPVKSIFKTKGLEVNSYANFPSLNPLSDAGTLIHQILEVIQHRPIEPKQQKGLNYSYFQDRTFVGQVKSIGLNSKHCFFKVKDDTTDFETLLHVKGCHGARVFDHMSTYLYPTDSIRFKVDEIQGDKLVVSIHDALKQHAEIVLKQPIETICVLVKRYDSRLFFISEEGYPIVLMTEEACQYKIGSFFKIQLNDFNQLFHYFMASSSVLVPVAHLVAFNAVEAYRNYLMAVGVLFPNTHKAVELNVPSDDRLRGLALLYLNVLEQRLSFVQDINELVIHFYLIVTISSIIRIPKSYEYVQKIEELKRTSFQLEETNSESIAVKEKTSNCIVEQILGYLDTPMIQLPLPMNELEEAYLLFKLVESSNLVKLLDVHHTQEFYFKGLIEKELIKLKRTDLLSGLLDKKEAERFKIAPLTNLGMESKVQEFKSSFFYSASEEIQIDVILRTINGFLNAYEGGKLFIGVDDRGDIIGLKHDLNYNEIPRTLDQYLNEIIATINKVYPKLVGTNYLDFKFHQVNGLDYLEIAIQPFDKPIPFRNVFYQRQGNRTIQLIGNDLVDFMEKVFKDQIEKTSGIQHELQPIDELAS